MAGNPFSVVLLFSSPYDDEKKKEIGWASSHQQNSRCRILRISSKEKSFNTTYTLHYTLPYAVCLPRNSGGGGSLVAPWCVFEWTSPPSNTIPASSSQPCPMLECFFFFFFVLFFFLIQEKRLLAVQCSRSRRDCLAWGYKSWSDLMQLQEQQQRYAASEGSLGRVGPSCLIK